MNLNALITDARASAGLSLENLAALTTLDEARLDAIEANQAAPETWELDAVARSLGLELPAFMQGEEGSSALLFRSMGQDVALEDVLGGGDGLVLGDFLRCVGRVGELRALLEEPLPEPTWLDGIAPVPISGAEPPWVQGEALAARARAWFELGEAPIPSMRDFLREQGVEVFFLRPDRLQSSIDGASTCSPAPAVLVNPMYEEAPWNHRTTMAHELCHLLYDRDRTGSFLISPTSKERRRKGGRKRWSLFDEYLAMEQRANAFATYFLAPRAAVRRVISASRCSPASSDATHALMDEFGVGTETAANILWSAYGLTEATRRRLARQSPDAQMTFPYNELTPCRGLFEGQLRELALQAFVEGHIGRVRVRQLLDLNMTSELPQGREVTLTKEQRAPVLTHRDVARKHALRALMQSGDPRYLFPGDIFSTDTGWSVAVMEETEEGALAQVGVLELTHDFDRHHLNLAS